MSLEISIYLLNHHHHLCHKQIDHLEKYSTAPFINDDNDDNNF